MVDVKSKKISASHTGKKQNVVQMKNNLDELEIKIKKLINSHQELKTENHSLKEVVENLKLQLKEERNKASEVEAGLRKLTTEDSSRKKKSLAVMQSKLEELINEIDQSVSILNK